MYYYYKSNEQVEEIKMSINCIFRICLKVEQVSWPQYQDSDDQPHTKTVQNFLCSVISVFKKNAA